MTIPQDRSPQRPATAAVEIYNPDTGTVLGFPSFEAVDLWRLTGQDTWTVVRPASRNDQRRLPQTSSTASDW